MLRILVLALSLAAAPALAQGILEKWADDLANSQMEKWKKEKRAFLDAGMSPSASLNDMGPPSYKDRPAAVAMVKKAVAKK